MHLIVPTPAVDNDIFRHGKMSQNVGKCRKMSENFVGKCQKMSENVVVNCRGGLFIPPGGGGFRQEYLPLVWRALGLRLLNESLLKLQDISPVGQFFLNILNYPITI